MLRPIALLLILVAAAFGSSGSDDGAAPTTDAPSTTEAAPTGTDAPTVEVEGETAACGANELCVTITGSETTGTDLRLMLFETDPDDWPLRYRTIPTPSWVLSEYPAIPDAFPLEIRIPFTDNLFAITSSPIEGAELGLAVVTGAASLMTVDSTDARGFSTGTLVFEPDAAMDFGVIELALPAGDTCELNPYNPACLTGDKFWDARVLGDEDVVPGAIYLDVVDIDGDGTRDIITVGEPHFAEPDRPLTDLRLGIYYLNPDLTLRETEILDEWSEDDQTFYSPWGVRVIDHGGEPLIIVGTNIPELAPLEDGTGAVLSYRKVGGEWVRTEIVSNPQPTTTNYNSMIVVPCDIDADGDDDLALSSAFGSSAVGSWLENTGVADPEWIPHYQPMMEGIDPGVRGVLGYKCGDLDADGYPEVVYNAMFDIVDSDPPRYRGEIWLGLNPGPDGWDEPWEAVVIDDDNWASADMWFHDFDGDGGPELIANQIFSSTVTRYWHPGADLTASWEPEIIISGLTSPSDMWLTDMDGDGLVDIVSADHTAHTGVWHRNPGVDSDEPWRPSTIYRNIQMPGDFAMDDLDGDGDLDWIGISMQSGQAFVVEQTQPDSAAVITVSVPDDFDPDITRFILTLATELPVTGIPAGLLAVIENTDADLDGEPDVDQLLIPGQDLVLSFDDVGLAGDYYVVAGVYVEGGGDFQPVPGVDYLTASELVTFGEGTARLNIELGDLAEEPPADG
ncbi:MAG: VCBS repeat-containing protein [Acidimicrobiales bacterium]|nr:VCBS repeat-containing protein [Acidimicrobiales bacterium]